MLEHSQKYSSKITPLPSITHNSELKSVCPVCNSKAYNLVIPSATYCLFRCQSCSTWFDPIHKSNLSDQYSYEYYFSGEGNTQGYGDYLKDMDSNRQTFVRRFEQAEKILGNRGRVLDLGCALGESLAVAKERGWEDHLGVEVSDYCVKKGTERGLKVIHQSEFLERLPKGYFDLVLMQDVIEHVENPISELALAFQVLRPGGVIFISTPNVSSLSRRILGRRWYHFKPGEHVTYFSPPSAMMALLSVGFTKIRVVPGWSVMGIASIMQRLKRYSAVFAIPEKLLRFFGLEKIAIPIKIGNIDVWGIKPQK